MLRGNYNRDPYKRPFDLLLKSKKGLVGAEVGVYRGQHAREILTDLDINKLYLVDPWQKYDEYNEKKLGNQLEEAYYDSKKLLKEFDDGRVVWLKGFSVDIAKQIEDNSLDFVYIDGNHLYEFIKQDIEVWTPKLKEGGYIGGHDFDSNVDKVTLEGVEYGVNKAVREYCKKNNIKFESRWCNPHDAGEASCDWAFKKGGKIENWGNVSERAAKIVSFVSKAKTEFNKL
jgi:hypothetical protein